MIALQDDRLEPLAALYLAANTPGFLYDTYRRSLTVQTLAATQQVQDLVETVNHVAGMAKRSLADVVTAYAALVALTLKDYEDVGSELPKLAMVGLEWTEKLIAIWDGLRMSTSRQSFELPAKLSEKPIPQTTATAAHIITLG